MWVPRDGRLHVAVRKSDPAPTVSGVTVHRLRSEGWGSSEAALPLETNLHLALRHHSVEVGLTVVESAVEQGLLTPMAAARLVEGQTSRRYHSGLRHFDPRSGSGSETRVRLWFQRRNVRVRSQVHIAGVGRIDLLVGESLVIEVDSAAFHTGRDRYEEDRRRDLTLTALGFQVVRLAYAQVFASWPTTVVLLKQVLGSGRYRLPPSPDALLHLPELRRLAA
jgi:very-short-patch-repair endonuclease